jgi:ribA/ribD-fused uncharacterized protein
MAIRTCTTPGLAKRLAATPAAGARDRESWFIDSEQADAAPRLDGGQERHLRRADIAKYAQNPDFAARLLATEDVEIVEDAPNDAYWGIGSDGAGENWAGRILMEVRQFLRAGATSSASIGSD